MIEAPSDRSIETLLRYYRDNGLSGAINVFFHEDGSVAVSVQRNRQNAYFGATDNDPVRALERALCPQGGVSWKAFLEHFEHRPRANRVGARGDNDVEDDEDDYLSVI